MSRKRRLFGKSEIYHVILRGNNKQSIFYSNNDRYFFVNRMKKYSELLNIDIYSYCLMDNHVHILLGKANAVLSNFIQRLATSYAMFFNRKYERSGHLFQGRFKSEIVDNDEYFKTVTRYILRNPEKNGYTDFKSYKWSSYKAITSKTENSFIKVSKLFEYFADIDSFINFINIKNKDICMEYENKFFINDMTCIRLIKSKFKKKPNLLFQNLDIIEILSKIKILKNWGMSDAQIARITGISLKFIKAA